jgi:hypothetical protein
MAPDTDNPTSAAARDALDVTDQLAPLLIGLPVAPDLAERRRARG